LISTIRYDEIQTIAGVEPQPFVFYRQVDLPLHGKAAPSELVSEAMLVSRFQ
jgi:hypothetical protein